MQNIILGQHVSFDVLQGVCISVERYSDQRSRISGGNGLIIDGTGSIAPITSEAWTTHGRRVAFESNDLSRLVFDFPADFDVEVQDKMSVVIAQIQSGERHITSIANRSTGGRYDFDFHFQHLYIKKDLKREVKTSANIILIVVALVLASLKVSLSSAHYGLADRLGEAITFGCVVLFLGFIIKTYLLHYLKNSIQSDTKKDFDISVRNKSIEIVGA